jgi:ATP-dependent DNA helicase RecG
MAKMEQTEFNFESHSGPLLTPDEIFEQCNEEMLRKLLNIEDRRFEKKSARIQPRDLSEYFSMWANTQPYGGVIILGISKDKLFEGCSMLSTNQRNELETTADIFCPDAKYTMKHIPIRNDNKQDDFVIVFRVYYHESKVVLTSGGRAFVRSGDSKRELKGEAIKNLMAEKGEIRFELEPCCVDYPQAFDAKQLSEFAEYVRTVKRWEPDHSKEDILELLHLGANENGCFIPNLACLLLFAYDPRAVVPGCRIRFLRFSGETEGTGPTWNAVKDEFIDGNIPTQLQKAEQVLKSQLRTFSRLGKGNKFFTSPEYPEFAWYEAIVNACVHRNYGNGMKNMPIFVKMFDDRLVVESPGAFPAFVTPENIYDTHNPRNPYLMDAMFYLKFVKCAHEGTRRIRSNMIEMDLPEPIFEQDDKDRAMVRVTLRNNIKQRKVWVDADVVEILGAQIAHSLDENEKRCINFAAEYGKISVSDTQRLTKLSWPAASKLLKRLVEKNILESTRREKRSRDPAARYKIRGHA